MKNGASRPIGKGGRASQQSQDAVFIGVVTGFFCVIKLLECCIDDVHHDVMSGVFVTLASHSYETQVALQIERQEFIQSKIIDRVADEDDDLVFVEQKKKLTRTVNGTGHMRFGDELRWKKSESE